MKLINEIKTELNDFFKVSIRDNNKDCEIIAGEVFGDRHMTEFMTAISLEELKSLISVLQTAQYTMEQGKKNV